MSITIDLEKARAISHAKRRRSRDAEFGPHDAIIAKQIPGEDHASAEEARATIRDKYARIQEKIDSANTVEDLLDIVKSF